MQIFLGLDTHIFDHLDAEPTAVRARLIEYLTESRRQLLITAVNVLEAACCPRTDARVALLRLMFKLAGGCRPLALPGDLFRGEIESFAHGRPSATITIGPEQEGLWTPINCEPRFNIKHAPPPLAS